MTGVEKLLEHGTPTEIAARLTSEDRPCVRQTVEYWGAKGYVPGTWAPIVAREFSIPLHELNPVIYPREVA